MTRNLEYGETAHAIPGSPAGATFVASFALLVCIGMAEGSAKAECLDPPGDITENGTTNVIDVQCEILATLAGLDDSPLPLCLAGGEESADLSCDGAVSVVDVLVAVYLVLDIALATDADGDGWVDDCGCGEGFSCPEDPEDFWADASTCEAGSGVEGEVVLCQGEDW